MAAGVAGEWQYAPAGQRIPDHDGSVPSSGRRQTFAVWAESDVVHGTGVPLTTGENLPALGHIP